MGENQGELDESVPVGDDENVLRRILKDPQYYDPSLPMPVTRAAFIPSKRDTTGISLFRSRFTSPQAVATSANNPKGCHVAQLRVLDLRENKVNIVPKPTPKDDPSYIPGHAEIPEINRVDYEADAVKKQTIKDLALVLAGLASGSIVI